MSRTDRSLARVLVVDDNPVIRLGLRSLFSFVAGVTEVLEASDGSEAVEVARKESPDLVLLDVRMPGTDGLTALPSLVEIAPVVMLTHSEEPAVISAALRAGASGYLVHGTFGEEELSAAVRVCFGGGTVLGAGVAELLAPASEVPSAAPAPAGGSVDPRFAALTRREVEIMELIGSGVSNADIGARLFLSPKTVKNHINRIYDKVGLHTRSEAIAAWLRRAEA